MNMKKMKGMFFGMAAGIIAAGLLTGLTAASCPAYAETGTENGPGAETETMTENAAAMTAMYRVYENGTGWSEYTADNTLSICSLVRCVIFVSPFFGIFTYI